MHEKLNLKENYLFANVSAKVTYLQMFLQKLMNLKLNTPTLTSLNTAIDDFT